MVKKAITKIYRAFRNDKQLRFGILGVSLLILIGIFAPYISTHDPFCYDDAPLLRPGKDGHIFGTNHLGQDVFSMLLYGIRTSLAVALGASMISGTLGVLIGGLGGYIGGKIDVIVSEFINIFLMIPTFFLILLIVALFSNSIFYVMIILGLTTWPRNAKLMRAQALSLRERTFVQSAVAMGETKGQILFKYILPNGIFPVIANTTRGMAGAILTEASLSFLGLGDPNIISWGQMIQSGRGYMATSWWLTVLPGIAVVITVILFYMIGDGLNHVLNPKYNYGRSK